jgi:hypothetical protein
MSITGAGFLKVSKATEFEITDHALARLQEYLGFHPTRGLAEVLFRHGRHLRHEELTLLGYRPAYHKRLKMGLKSWYFRFVVLGQEVIAVLTEGHRQGQLIWVTTYHPDEQSEHFRVADYSMLSAA